jgi:predicted Zn-dependent peptidase
MQWVGESLLNYGRFVKPDEVVANLMAVTVADLRQVAAELFTPQHLTLSLVVPEQETVDETSWLGTFAALG